MLTSYQGDLHVWRAGMDLVELVYRLTTDCPEREPRDLTGQLRRSAAAVPSSLAEGRGCRCVDEFLYHVSAAEGSLAELRTQIVVAGRLCYFSPQQAERALEQAAALAVQLVALRDALSRYV